MDWKSKRVRTILETALSEDKASNDITTALTIDPKLRASGTIIAKEACIVSGLGCVPAFFEAFAIDNTKVSLFELQSQQRI